MELINELGESADRYELIGGYNYQGQTEKILQGLGFRREDFNKKTDTFSGGWRMRIELAKLLLQSNDLLLLDEPTNHLDMVSRNVGEKALDQYIGSIVCISHDRHFLNHITSLTGEVGKGRIRMYEGNYEYYEWKKNKSIPKEELISKEKIKPKVKSDYKERKKLRNRLAWIRKRNKSIETELENQRIIVQDPDNGGNYDVLQKAMELMNSLEKEYLELMEEEELLNNK